MVNLSNLIIWWSLKNNQLAWIFFTSKKSEISNGQYMPLKILLFYLKNDQDL